MSNLSQEVLLAFVRASVTTQYNLAVKARSIQNGNYVLFDARFHHLRYSRIGDIRVAVDAMDRPSILSTAAQNSLNFEQYSELISDFKDIVVVDECVYLRALPKEPKLKAKFALE